MPDKKFGALRCRSCAKIWAVELRNASSNCPACGANNELDPFRLVWTGDDAKDVIAAVSQLRAAGTTPLPLRVPRHDDPLDAAAAQARGLPPSRRAEAVATALAALTGDLAHDQLTEALLRAGLPHERAQRELVRLLATDRLMEPSPGRYRLLA